MTFPTASHPGNGGEVKTLERKEREKSSAPVGRGWMGTLSAKAEVVSLVKDRLGCGCPDEVFDHYQVQFHPFGHFPVVQLVMKDRLLIWLVDGTTPDLTERTLLGLLDKGRDERDRRQLNRFRLVVIGDDANPKYSRHEVWSHLAGVEDSKVHLHFLKGL